MSDGLETSEQRKARLAALRKKNKSSKAVSDVPQTEVLKEDATLQKGEIAAVQEEEVLDAFVPSLRISNDETVEVLAARIQRQIYERIHQRIAEPEGPEEKQKPESVYGNDLKNDINGHLQQAKHRTDSALEKIIQKKYEERLRAGEENRDE